MPGTTFNTADWSGFDEQSVTNPAAALTDFTLLIDVSTLSATFKSTVQSDGGDIRATKGDDTELPYDLIDWRYNAGAPTGFLRVKWSGTLSTSGTQNVRVWAGYVPGTAVAYDAGETFGRHNAYDANWEGYWPLHDLSDRTSNGLMLSPLNSPTSGQTGKLGDCFGFSSASSQWMNVTQGLVTGAPLTVMAWANPNNVTDSMVVGSLNDASENTSQFALIANGPGSDECRWSARTTSQTSFVDALSPNSYSASAWSHFVGVEESSASRLAYLNGGAPGSNTADRTPGGIDNFAVGALGDNTPGAYFDGLIDDVQLHSTARSADWIAHEYDQSNDNAAFWGTWSWTAAGHEPLTANPATVSYTGQAVDLLASRALAASPASVQYAGQSVTLAAARVLSASHATVQYAGQSVELTAGGPDFTLTVNPATVHYAGQQVGMSFVLTASAAAVNYTGQSAGLIASRVLTAAPAVVNFSGQAVGMAHSEQVDTIDGVIVGAAHSEVVLAEAYGPISLGIAG